MDKIHVLQVLQYIYLACYIPCGVDIYGRGTVCRIQTFVLQSGVWLNHHSSFDLIRSTWHE